MFLGRIVCSPGTDIWVNQYFSAHSIRPTIFNAQKRVDGLIESFMLTTAVGTRLGVQSIRTDLRIMRSALTPPSSDTGAEPEFRDFHKLIPGDLQLIPPPRPVPSAEIPEGHIEYPVLVGGVRMTARIYRGENASQVGILSACPSTVMTPNSSGAKTSISFPASGIHGRFSCSDTASLLVNLLWCFTIRMNRCRTRTQHALTYRPSAAVAMRADAELKQAYAVGANINRRTPANAE
ncbi:hypothetical protein B0H19DRAFT_281445 [Mycena capillaripes]|nr:hypothetical protein B0H19DRAFT_281445 [Mycena capillaripes]